MRCLVLLLVTASFAWADEPRDIPSREDFVRLLEALGKGTDNALEELRGKANADGDYAVKPEFGLAADPDAKRYRIRPDPGFKKEVTAQFIFWEREDQTEAQDGEALADYSWMLKALEERFGSWRPGRVFGEPGHSREYYNAEGRGKVRLTVGLTNNSRWRDKAKGEKPHLRLQLTFWTVARSNDPSVISISSPSHLVRALGSRALRKWWDPYWIGRDLLHDDRLHRHDWILSFNGVAIGREEWRSPFLERLADRVHEGFRKPGGKVPTFQYQRDGEVRKLEWRPKSLDLGRYEGRRENGVPTGSWTAG